MALCGSCGVDVKTLVLCRSKVLCGPCWCLELEGSCDRCGSRPGGLLPTDCGVELLCEGCYTAYVYRRLKEVLDEGEGSHVRH